MTRLLAQDMTPRTSIAIAGSLAATALAVTAPFALAFESLQVEWNTPVILAMLWSVLVLTGGGISLIFVMLRQGRATTVTSYMYMVPAVTALMAWAMFGESLSPLAIGGMGVSLLGIWLVATRPA